MAKSEIIKNAGYMWHRKYVDWDGGELTGYPERSGGDPVDFAPQSGIYALYDHNFRCVYVGQAGSGDITGLYDRLKDHVNDYLYCMWERFSWFGFYSIEALSLDKKKYYEEEFNIKTNINTMMDIIESLIIHVQLPVFNKSMGRKISKISWYYQEEEYKEQKIFLKDFKEKCNLLKE